MLILWVQVRSMIDLKGIKELVEVLLDLLPSHRRMSVRKQKLESALLQAQIQKTVAETNQIESLTLQTKFEMLNGILDVVNTNFSALSLDSKVLLVEKIWKNFQH